MTRLTPRTMLFAALVLIAFRPAIAVGQTVVKWQRRIPIMLAQHAGCGALSESHLLIIADASGVNDCDTEGGDESAALCICSEGNLIPAGLPSEFVNLVVASGGITSQAGQFSFHYASDSGAQLVGGPSNMSLLVGDPEGSSPLEFAIYDGSVRAYSPLGIPSSANLPTCDESIAPSGITALMIDTAANPDTLCGCPAGGGSWYVIAPAGGSCAAD